MLDQGGAIDAVYLDFAKAFDTVPHQRLLRKLEGYGVTGKLLDWFRDFLVGRRQRVGVAGSFSGWSQVLSGVPEGYVLGPLMFVCYINDLPETIASFIFLNVMTPRFSDEWIVSWTGIIFSMIWIDWQSGQGSGS